MISEIRYTVRSLLQRKGFALVVIVTLALGIGSATAIYSVVDWILFRGPPSPKDLYAIGAVGREGSFMPFVWQAHLAAYRARQDIFSEVSQSTYQSGNVVVDREPVENGYDQVSLNFFKMLNIRPAMGRDFVQGEDVEGKNEVVIVSEYFWRERLGGTADALGRKIIVNRRECTVVGILRKGERLPVYSNSNIYMPLVLHPNPAAPWDPSLIVFARTRPGVSQKQAEAALAQTKVDLPPQMDWFGKDNRVGLSSIHDLEKIVGPETYWILVAAVAFLFCIACLNATNLVLVHLVGKQHETSIRLALGGGRWGILRLLLIETSLLSLCGSLFGALIANWLIPLFWRVAGSEDGAFNWMSWHLWQGTYWALGILTVVAGTVVSLVPSLHVLSSDIQGGLKHGRGSVGESPRIARLRATFVVLQAAFAVILLVGTGLMVRSFQRLEEVKLGFDAAHRVKIRLSFPSGYPEDSKERIATLDRLKADLEGFRGVSRVAYGSDTLLAGREGVSLEVEGGDGTPMRINGAYVSTDYQEAGGMVLKGGRWLSLADKASVMINESLARVRFGATNAVGQYLRPTGTKGDFRGWQVIGVVGDVRESMRSKPGIKVYMPASWSPQTVSSFVVDMKAEPNGKTESDLRKEVYRFDSRIVCYSADRLAEEPRRQLSSAHLAFSVLQVLSAIAVLLTVVGLFSVLAYTVDRRMGEFGIRMALGATPMSLISLVMYRGLALTGIGIVAGVVGAIGLTRFMQSILYETESYDPAVIAGVAGLLVLSAFAACLLPAIRASRPDLVELLRSD